MKSSTANKSDDMKNEYNFSIGERGKHHKKMLKGYSITIHKSDGTTEVKEIKPPSGTVFLAPDVQAYFPDSEAVNSALRTLITIIPSKRKPASA
jgi:hypothetical protein